MTIIHRLIGYTPDMFAEPSRIVPHDEGAARLAAVREAVAALPDMPPLCRVGRTFYMRHERDGGRCSRCGWEYPRI